MMLDSWKEQESAVAGMAFTQLRNRVERFLTRGLPSASPVPGELPPGPIPVHQGFVDERSRFHVSGWVRRVGHATERPEVAVWLRRRGSERLLARLRAEEFSEPLFKLGIGDGHYAFHALFDTPLADDGKEEETIVVRVVGSDYELPRAPAERRGFTPIGHIAVDIVNNCNLRCPFCLYDYSTTRATRFMSEKTFRNILPLAPYVAGANFWLSCVHEPTLHPDFTRFIGLAPEEHRNRIFFTTNLAKRQPESYFAFLAESGIHHINISVESFDKAIYERMRKGARHAIFLQNLDRLSNAFARAANPPRLRFVSQAFRSNLDELPELVAHTRQRYGAWQNEIRYTHDMPFIDQSFKDAEHIDDAAWDRIRRMFAGEPPDRLILMEPPGKGPPPGGAAQPRFAPRPLNMRIDWKGDLYVYGPKLDESGDQGGYELANYAHVNINTLRHPLKFLMSL